MNVLRHWTATKTDADKTLLRDFIAAEWVESYRAAGWTVEGPFVPEPPEGAVTALELAQTALHKLCLARGSMDGYGHVFEAINAALPAMPHDHGGPHE